MDIEDIVKSGNWICACPYFSIWNSIYDSDIIAVPYQSLLHKSTRESLDIQLANRIIIFDEAHNVMESIWDMYRI